MIETPPLTLLPFEVGHARALQRGTSTLGSMLRVAVPEGWSQFPEAYAVDQFRGSVDEDPPSTFWGSYLFLLKDRSALVGSGGYKGEPSDGIVEVGYEIAPGYQNRGFATEATRGMI